MGDGEIGGMGMGEIGKTCEVREWKRGDCEN